MELPCNASLHEDQNKDKQSWNDHPVPHSVPQAHSTSLSWPLVVLLY